MKLSECSIIIVPGFGNSGSDHWQTRWETKLSNARRVVIDDWMQATRAHWMERIIASVDAAEKAPVLVGHSLGVAAIAHAAPHFTKPVAGAFLVAASDWDKPDLLPGVTHDFAPLPLATLPFRSMLVASRNDPYCTFDRAQHMAAQWGAGFIDAGESGHINAESGHGPWPEGLMSFAGFLNKI